MKKVTVKSVDIPHIKPERSADVTLYFPIELSISVSRSTPNWMKVKEECLKLHEGDRVSIVFPSGKGSVSRIPANSSEGKRIGDVDLLYFYDAEYWECSDPVVFNDYHVNKELFVLRALCKLQDHVSVRVIKECNQRSQYPSCSAVLDLKAIDKSNLPHEIVSIEDCSDADDRYTELQKLFDKYEKLFPDGMSDVSKTAVQNAPPKSRKPSPRYEDMTGKDISVGARFRFGLEKKPWVILKVVEDQMLVISDDCVCMKDWGRGVNCTWEVSKLRQFLNDSYYNEKFSESERGAILLTHNTNPGNTSNTIDGGNDTDDHLFILSSEQINELMPDKSSRERTKFWWVRTPGANSERFCFVGAKGTIFSNGWIMEPRGVRPCMWIKLP